MNFKKTFVFAFYLWSLNTRRFLLYVCTCALADGQYVLSRGGKISKSTENAHFFIYNIYIVWRGFVTKKKHREVDESSKIDL
jgi:hypothetical protein